VSITTPSAFTRFGEVLMRRLPIATLTALFIALFSARANAIPVLQLDMLGGVYDFNDETVVASSGDFTLYAILTPSGDGNKVPLSELLARQYYVSVAITPQTGPQSASLGAISIESQPYVVTDDLIYGRPPIGALKTVPGHGIYDTYFLEVPITFLATQRTTTYNTEDSPNGLEPNEAGESYYVAISGNTGTLATGHNLHFDLYDAVVADCKKNDGCAGITVDHFAPPSHDAATRVPEPATAFLLLMGVCALGSFPRRRP
jgi:hypothetical protein